MPSNFPHLPLSDLADLIPGHPVPPRQKTMPAMPPRSHRHRKNSTTIYLIQEKDIDAPELPQHLATISSSATQNTLQYGDLIYHSQRQTNPASIFTRHASCGPCLCAEPLAGLRIRKSANLLPHYLAWYINSPIVRACAAPPLSRTRRDWHIPIQELFNQPVLVPSLERQRNLLHVFFREQQRQLTSLKKWDAWLEFCELRLLDYLSAKDGIAQGLLGMLDSGRQAHPINPGNGSP